MPLQYLESFFAVAETLSFTEAAQRLQTTQPSISRQIRLLEENLETQLFARTRASVALTPRGQELVVSLKPLFQGLRQGMKAARENSHELKGSMTFGCFAEIGQSVFMKSLLEFQAGHPHIELAVEYLKEFEIIERLQQGTLGLGVIASAQENQENIRTYAVHHERVVLVTRRENKEEPRPGAELAVVSYRKLDPLLEKFRKKFKNRVSFRNIVTVNSHRSMMDSLMRLDAFAVMPLHVVESALSSGQLRRVTDLELVNTLYLAHLGTRHMERRYVEMKKYLLKQTKGQR